MQYYGDDEYVYDHGYHNYDEYDYYDYYYDY